MLCRRAVVPPYTTHVTMVVETVQDGAEFELYGSFLFSGRVGVGGGIVYIEANHARGLVSL
jgi:hypothetical protein